MLSKLIGKALQPYWRMTRGMTLGAQAIIEDHEQRILLVRHGYRPGWHFPGGGVEWSETCEHALARELREETGVVLTGRPQLLGIYSNFEKFPGDHIALYVAREWHQEEVPRPNPEILEQGFYRRDELPDGTIEAVRRRLGEWCGDVPISPHW